MRAGLDRCVIAVAALAGFAAAEKGAATVYGCVWHNTKPVKSYTVDWHPGSSSDKCMRLTGSAASMTVSSQGLTCQTVGKVAVDSSGLCYFRESWWGMSYTSNVAYSGSTNSRWTTGPANSDSTLHDQSPGTSVCASESHCTGTYVEWDNDTNALLRIVFEPGKVGDPGKEKSAEVDMVEDEGEPKMVVQGAELEI